MTPFRRPTPPRLPASWTRNLFVLALVALAGLISCQSTTGPSTGPSANFNRSASLTLPAALHPDSAVLERDGKPIGKASVSIDGETVKLGFTLPSDMDKDTIWVRLWSHGLQFRSLAYAMVGSEPKLVNSKVINELATVILKRLDSVMTQDTSLHDEHKTLVELVGKAIVDGDPDFEDWSHRLPAGIDVETADSAALAIVVRSGKRLADVAEVWIATLDREQAVALLETWVEKNLITSEQRDVVTRETISDSIPPTIHLVSPGSDTTVSEDVSSLSISMRATDSSGIDSVRISGETSRAESFQRSVELSMGPNVVHLEAWDKVGLYTEKLLTIIRKEKDTTLPVVKFRSPSKDTTVSASRDTFVVTVSASDASGIDSVWIGSDLFTSGPYTTTVHLQAGENKIKATARDTRGNFDSATLVIVRERDRVDSIRPTLKRLRNTPRQDTTVSAVVASIDLTWLAEDETSLDSVLLNGSVLERSDSIYSRKADLTEGKNTFVVIARDKAGNTTTDTLRVTRAKDTTAPNVEIVLPGHADTIVSNSVSRMVVKVAASDESGIDSVHLRGHRFTNAPYQDTISLEVGTNVVPVQAWDKFGNSSVDTVIIRREPAPEDTTRPTIVRLTPLQDTSVAWSASRMLLKWKVMDDSGLASVTLDSSKLEGTEDVFQAEVDLRVGKNLFVLEAVDRKGNVRHDTLAVTRSGDDTPPSVDITAPSEDTTVAAEMAKVVIRVAASDANGIDSVRIADRVFKSAPYQDTVLLNVGANRIQVTAWDKAGNSASDSVVITRKRALGDTTRPSISRLSPTRDTSVSWSTRTIQVKWNVTDDSSLASVAVGATTLTGTDDLFEADFALVVGENIIALKAVDSKGNFRVDSLRVVRLDDTSPPVLGLVSPKRDTAVASDLASLLVKVSATDPSGIDSVRIGTEKLATGPFEATMSLVPGANEIKISAWDKAGNRSDTSVVVTRWTEDSVAPEITRSVGASNRTIPYDSTATKLTWKVLDNVKLTEVRINGAVITGTSNLFSITASGLKIGANGFRIVAKDSTGNSATDTVTITRAWKDTLAPVIVRSTSTGPRSIAFQDSVYTPSWTVTDDSALKSVTIQATAVTGTAGVFSKAVTLPLGKTLITLVATDVAGHVVKDTFTVVRMAKDEAAPVITRSVGASNRILPYDSSSTKLTWKVVDDAKLADVRINGTLITGASDLYTITASALKIGTNGFRIVATDATGNSATDSVTITRGWKDTLAPVVVRSATTGPQTIAYEDSIYTPSWTVTDDSALKAVTIQATDIAGVTDVFSKSLTLGVGKTLITLMAEDYAGHVVRDTFTVERVFQDVVDPVITRDLGASNRSLPYDSSATTLAWKVMDETMLSEVRINGSVITGASDLYSIPSGALKVGSNGFRIVAKDTAGNSATDTVTITRGWKDTLAPVVVRSATTGPQTIAYEDSIYVPSWTVTDDSALRSVTIQSVAVTGASGVFSKSLTLGVGKTLVTLVATDAAGHVVQDTFTVERVFKDVVDPVITRDLGASDRSLPYDSSATTLAWKVMDETMLSEVRINGSVITGASDLYSIPSGALKVGSNGFRIVAKDTAGNSATDTVTITRGWKDTLPPIFVRSPTTGPRTVLYNDSVYTPSWTVTDDSALKAVTIQASAVTGAADVYSKSVTLQVGQNLILLSAEDHAGHIAQDTFTVVRSLGTIPDLVLSHAEGIHDSVLHVTITSSTPGATIRYTIDGSDPSSSATALTYSSRVLIDRTRTLKAYATAPDHVPSAVSASIYTLVVPSPIPSLPSGTTTDTVFAIQFASPISNVTIHYTLDGSTPTTSSPWVIPGWDIDIDSIRTLKILAVKTGWTNSAVSVLEYKANVPVKVFFAGSSVVLADGSLWSLPSDGAQVDGTDGATSDYAKVMEDVKTITASHILKNNGDLYAYGRNDYGQYGDGSTASSDIPVFIRSGVKSVVDGGLFSMIIDNSGTLYAAGDNTEGNFCNETTESSTTYKEIRSGVADMATGYSSSRYGNQVWTLLVTTSGDAFSCGSGVLGLDTFQTTKPMLIGSGYSAAFAMDAGGSFFAGASYLIKANGDAYSTGSPTRHLVLDATGSDRSFIFVRSYIKSISGTDENIFMLDTYGRVWAAGNNMSGAFGNGSTDPISPPETVMTEVKAVSGSGGRSTFIKKNGALWAVGGDLGYTPVRVRLP